ncbi:glutathione S-transferase family protein [Reyranella sp. CPCC 100927]|uniref:glutathione S-transferase family protein n=1 Tax=Reyranella sp. CPCC 100927 TaxID=2599616 RepID=UPI0011B6F9AC|nr:glutathione S-transferase family protein [Reyranella sp. CPCC 100927]TWT15467.1 glutathione S-transferase family protein [Reyranella sp. CPCC 100927]
MRLYDYGPSQNCFKVRLLASHLNLNLEIVPVAIFRGEGATPAFLSKNPTGAVPVLETDTGECLAESNAILTFLAEGSRYLPLSGMARACVIRWLMFEQQYVQPSIGLLRYWTQTSKLDQYALGVPSARAFGNRALDILDGELGKRPFVAGDRYTIADMSLFAYSHVAADAHLDVSTRKNLTAWFDRVRAEPDFKGDVIPYSIDPDSRRNLPFAG